jgi:hypothetical protein
MTKKLLRIYTDPSVQPLVKYLLSILEPAGILAVMQPSWKILFILSRMVPGYASMQTARWGTKLVLVLVSSSTRTAPLS